MTQFLNRYMKEQATSFDIESGRKLFLDVVKRLHKIQSGKPVLRPGYSVTPQNQLEAILVALGTLIRGKKKIATPPAKWLEDEVLVKFSTKGTNTRKAFEGRNERALQLLAG